MNYRSYTRLALAILSLTAVSCKKFLGVAPPVNQLSASSVYGANTTAIAVMTNVYVGFPIHNYFYNDPGLMSDELSLYDLSEVGTTDLYWNRYTNATQEISSIWTGAYSNISTANSVLENLQNAPALSPAVVQQLKGEAYFVRGLSYFCLVNLYGGVPLTLTSDYKVNALLGRTSADSIWAQVESDVRTAKGLLSQSFVDASLMSVSTERTRPTYWAADALLARVLLYEKKWSGADSASSEVIANQGLFRLVSPDSIVIKNNNEAIWQLQETNSLQFPTTPEGAQFNLPTTGPDRTGNYPMYLSNSVMNSFEAGDLRRQFWVDSVIAVGVTYHYPYKYKIGNFDSYANPNEYSTLFRLAEQYLIRAEAEVEQNELSLAVTDINMIRTRAGLGATSAATQDQVLAAIMQERRVELFTEGHRWFDLKRTGALDSVMTTVCQQKGAAAWQSFKALWPIPGSEFVTDPSLRGQQNPGYN